MKKKTGEKNIGKPNKMYFSFLFSSFSPCEPPKYMWAYVPLKDYNQPQCFCFFFSFVFCIPETKQNFGKTFQKDYSTLFVVVFRYSFPAVEAGVAVGFLCFLLFVFVSPASTPRSVVPLCTKFPSYLWKIPPHTHKL